MSYPKQVSWIVETAGVRCREVRNRMRHSEMKHLFSLSERRRAMNLPRPEESLAARLAAKRAIACVLLRRGFYLTEDLFHRIEISNQKSGGPFVRVLDRRLESRLNLRSRILISLSHSRIWGIASAAIKR